MAGESESPQRLTQVVIWTLADFYRNIDIANRCYLQYVTLIDNVQILTYLSCLAVKEEQFLCLNWQINRCYLYLLKNWIVEHAEDSLAMFRVFWIDEKHAALQWLKLGELQIGYF